MSAGTPPTRHRIALTTLLAIVCMLGTTTWAVVAVAESIQTARDPEAARLLERDELIAAGAPSGVREIGNRAAIEAWFFGSLSALAVGLAIGVAVRRDWARTGTLFVFGTFAAVAGAVSVSGLLAEPPGEDAGEGIVVAAADAAVVALLLTRSSTRDFEAVESARRRAWLVEERERLIKREQRQTR